VPKGHDQEALADRPVADFHPFHPTLPCSPILVFGLRLSSTRMLAFPNSSNLARSGRLELLVMSYRNLPV
jgi:hypothetical protein